MSPTRRSRSCRICATVALPVLLAGCAAAGTRPLDMSAAEHDQMADHEDRTAARHESRFDPHAARSVRFAPVTEAGVCPYGEEALCGPLWSSTTNPTESHLREARAHRAAAAGHRVASRALRDAESRRCAGIPEADRDVSPFFHTELVVRVDELRAPDARDPRPVGARIFFRRLPGFTASMMRAIVDCHLARNAALGFAEHAMPDCPLNVKGARAQVGVAGDALIVDLSAARPAAAREILRRARALVSPGPVSSAAGGP